MSLPKGNFLNHIYIYTSIRNISGILNLPDLIVFQSIPLWDFGRSYFLRPTLEFMTKGWGFNNRSSEASFEYLALSVCIISILGLFKFPKKNHEASEVHQPKRIPIFFLGSRFRVCVGMLPFLQVETVNINRLLIENAIPGAGLKKGGWLGLKWNFLDLQRGSWVEVVKWKASVFSGRVREGRFFSRMIYTSILFF